MAINVQPSTPGDRNLWKAITRIPRVCWFGADPNYETKCADLLNAETLDCVNAAGTAAVGVIGLNSSNVTVFPNTSGNTFTGPVTFSGGTNPTGPTAAGATLAVTAAMAGSTILLNTAAGSVVTLPAATGTGRIYRFVVTTTTTSGAHKILAASSSDFLNGILTGENAGTAKCFASAAATNHSLQMPFSGSQPSGGFIGDWFEIIDVATNLWQVMGMYQAGTTPTTPFSSATS